MMTRFQGWARLACACVVLGGPWALAMASAGELPDAETNAVARQVESTLRSWMAAVNAAGTQGTSDCPDWVLTALPKGGSFDRAELRGQAVIAYLSLPGDFLSCLTPDQCEAAIRAETELLRPIDGLTGAALFARPVGDSNAEYQALPAYLPPPVPLVKKPSPSTTALNSKSTEPGLATSFDKIATTEVPGTEAGGLPTYNPGRPQGALSGKTVFLSPGHGWLYNSSYNAWMTQRGQQLQHH